MDTGKKEKYHAQEILRITTSTPISTNQRPRVTLHFSQVPWT
jgi:hypothetical protein